MRIQFNKVESKITLMGTNVCQNGHKSATQVICSDFSNNSDKRKKSLNQMRREEKHKTKILFFIVVNFVMCNMLRIILNFEEGIAQRDYHFALKYNCNCDPFWTLVTNTISQFLVLCNASVGFVIYCLVSKEFRAEVRVKFVTLCQRRRFM